MGQVEPPFGVPRWRARVVRAVARLPAPARRSVWRARRRLQRTLRRAREARGDYSASRPALQDMDRRLEAYLDITGGFFVEAGANDGYDQSNTYSLERIKRWRGILVEPVPELAEEARRERPASTVVSCALVAEGHPGASVTLRYGGLMTTVDGALGSAEEWVAPAHAIGQEQPEHEFEAPARTLSSVLDEAGAPEVDLLSLDVEGYEAEVLRGLDLSRHAPRFMLVEIRDMPSGRPPIDAIVGERYVAVAELSPFDLLYARRDQPAARAAV